MEVFGHGDGNWDVEGIAICGAGVEDEMAGDGACGDMDGGAGGAAEGDGGGDVADGGAGDVSAVGVEVLVVDVDLATGHGGDGSDVVEMRGVGLVGRQEGAEGGHTEVSVDGSGWECKCEGVTVIKTIKTDTSGTGSNCRFLFGLISYQFLSS